MGLFGPNRKKSLWDSLSGMSDPSGPVDPGMTSNPGYDPSSDPSYTDTDPSIGSVGGPPKKGFNWGNAAMAFFGGPEVAQQLHERRQSQDQADALAGLGYDENAVKALQSNPTALAQVLASRYQQRPPANNDTVADYNFISQTLGPDAAKKFLENKTLPPMMGVDVQGVDGSVSRQFYPRGSPPGQGSSSGPPPAAVQYLKQHPETAAEFDQKYGQGASQSIVGAGGPTGSRSGGFLGGRRPY